MSSSKKTLVNLWEKKFK